METSFCVVNTEKKMKDLLSFAIVPTYDNENETQQFNYGSLDEGSRIDPLQNNNNTDSADSTNEDSTLLVDTLNFAEGPSEVEAHPANSILIANATGDGSSSSDDSAPPTPYSTRLIREEIDAFETLKAQVEALQKDYRLDNLHLHRQLDNLHLHERRETYNIGDENGSWENEDEISLLKWKDKETYYHAQHHHQKQNPTSNMWESMFGPSSSSATLKNKSDRMEKAINEDYNPFRNRKTDIFDSSHNFHFLKDNSSGDTTNTTTAATTTATTNYVRSKSYDDNLNNGYLKTSTENIFDGKDSSKRSGSIKEMKVSKTFNMVKDSWKYHSIKVLVVGASKSGKSAFIDTFSREWKKKDGSYSVIEYENENHQDQYQNKDKEGGEFFDYLADADLVVVKSSDFESNEDKESNLSKENHHNKIGIKKDNNQDLNDGGNRKGIPDGIPAWMKNQTRKCKKLMKEDQTMKEQVQCTFYDLPGIYKRSRNENIDSTSTFTSTPTMESETLFNEIISNQKLIIEYILEKNEEFLTLEIDPERTFPLSDIEDPRIDMIFYMIEASGLSAHDIHFMKLVSSYVTVVPILTKADLLNEEEREKFKHQILKECTYHNISLLEIREERKERAKTKTKTKTRINVINNTKATSKKTSESESLSYPSPPFSYSSFSVSSLDKECSSDFPILIDLISKSDYFNIKKKTEEYYLQYRKQYFFEDQRNTKEAYKRRLVYLISICSFTLIGFFFFVSIASTIFSTDGAYYNNYYKYNSYSPTPKDTHSYHGTLYSVSDNNKYRYRYPEQLLGPGPTDLTGKSVEYFPKRKSKIRFKTRNEIITKKEKCKTKSNTNFGSKVYNIARIQNRLTFSNQSGPIHNELKFNETYLINGSQSQSIHVMSFLHANPPSFLHYKQNLNLYSSSKNMNESNKMLSINPFPLQLSVDSIPSYRKLKHFSEKLKSENLEHDSKPDLKTSNDRSGSGKDIISSVNKWKWWNASCSWTEERMKNVLGATVSAFEGVDSRRRKEGEGLEVLSKLVRGKDKDVQAQRNTARRLTRSQQRSKMSWTDSNEDKDAAVYMDLMDENELGRDLLFKLCPYRIVKNLFIYYTFPSPDHSERRQEEQYQLPEHSHYPYHSQFDFDYLLDFGGNTFKVTAEAEAAEQKQIDSHHFDLNSKKHLIPRFSEACRDTRRRGLDLDSNIDLYAELERKEEELEIAQEKINFLLRALGKIVLPSDATTTSSSMHISDFSSGEIQNILKMLQLVPHSTYFDSIVTKHRNQNEVMIHSLYTSQSQSLVQPSLAPAKKSPGSFNQVNNNRGISSFKGENGGKNHPPMYSKNQLALIEKINMHSSVNFLQKKEKKKKTSLQA